MEGINNVKQLEARLGAETGDLIMCSYEPPLTPPGSCLDIAVGLYNPYQGIDGGRLGPSEVDFTHGASQNSNLKKSNTCFRVHLIGHGYGDKLKIYNVPGTQTQIPVENIIDFKIIMKGNEVTEFYKDAL